MDSENALALVPLVPFLQNFIAAFPDRRLMLLERGHLDFAAVLPLSRATLAMSRLNVIIEAGENGMPASSGAEI